MLPVDARLLESCLQYLSYDVENAGITTAVLGSTIPLGLAVTLLSTPRLRKQWAFRILVVALFVMIVRSILNLQSEPRLYELYGKKEIGYDTIDEVYKDKFYVETLLAGYLSALFVPFICDCALLCRLLAFHPASITPLKKRIAILAFPLAAHVSRLPLLVAYCCLIVMEGSLSSRYEHAYRPLRVVEGGLQLLVNCYCSGFLLHKTYQYARADHAGQTAHSQQANRLRLRLRYMIESILFNFVPASLAQLSYFIAAFVELYPPYKDEVPWVWAQTYLRMLVCIFSLYFGLLAVWWSHIRTRGNEQPAEKQLFVTSAEDMSLLGWTLGSIAPEHVEPPAVCSNQALRIEKAADLRSEEETQKDSLEARANAT